MHAKQWVVIHSPFGSAERRMRRMLRLTVHVSVLYTCNNKAVAEMVRGKFRHTLTGPIGICEHTSIQPRGE